MNTTVENSDFELNLNIGAIATAYLACTWRGSVDEGPPSFVIKELNDAGVLTIGDIKVDTSSPQDDLRIKRIMLSCTGFVVVLPYRSEHPTGTSPYMVQELEIASQLGLPIAIFAESRIHIHEERTPEGRFISFSGGHKVPLINSKLYGLFRYDHGGPNIKAQMQGRLHNFVEDISRIRPKEQPYIFLNARMQTDFELARKAIIAAVEKGAGIPCLWFDDPRISLNSGGVRSQTRQIIKCCSLFIADLSYGKETPNIDNPNRAHEIGCAEACGRQILLFCQGPRRDPYFAASDMKVLFWDNEQELYEKMNGWIQTNRRAIARRVFNWELGGSTSNSLKIGHTDFQMEKKRRYIAPNLYALTAIERWVIAVGFGLIAFALSPLIKRWSGYGDTLNLAPILTAIIALVFASDLNNKIQRALGQFVILRWLVPFIGLALVIILAFSK